MRCCIFLLDCSRAGDLAFGISNGTSCGLDSLHILNMFALWYVGKAIELIHGHFQAASAFVIPAIGGIILSAIFLPQYITVGASGGIFGLIGACISGKSEMLGCV